ncbi:MAG: hypothetical protein K1X75_11200, partial [Leptospirales bacterium]|nr:hypothetical protein [Leptospirales bacterium]
MELSRLRNSLPLAFVLWAILCNSAILIIAGMQLSANTFWLRFLGYQAGAFFVSDALYRLLLYWPLTLPFWLPLLKVGGWQAPRRWGWQAMVLVVLQLALSVPVAQIDLSQTIQWRSLGEGAVIAGLSRPLAAATLILALTALVTKSAPACKAGCLLLALATIAASYLGRLLLEGPAIPRLEDELAYWIQSILIRDGRLVGLSPPPAGLSAGRWEELTLLPYVLRDGNLFFSAHQHGWSYLLAAFHLLSAAPYANLILGSISVVLLWITGRRLFPDSGRGAQWLAPGALILMPAHFFGAGNLMSHMSALCLEMASLLAWLAAGQALSRSRQIGMALLTLVALMALCFVRLQSGIAFILGLSAKEALALLFSDLRQPGDRQGPALRLAFLVFSVAIILSALLAYASLFPGGRVFFTSLYLDRHFHPGCQLPGFGPEYGCVPTYGTMGHSLRKLLLNGLEILQSLSIDLPLFGLPTVTVLAAGAVLSWPAVRKRPVLLLLVLLLCAHTAIYGLYWHNGGESFRGRYLLDAAYAPALLFGVLTSQLIVRVERMLPAFLAMFCLLSGINLLVQSRGAYVNVAIPPIHSLSALTADAPTNALIATSSEERDRIAPDEFNSHHLRMIPAQRMRAFVNDSAGTVAALAGWIDGDGFLRDSRGNYLLGPATDSELQIIARRTGAT